MKYLSLIIGMILITCGCLITVGDYAKCNETSVAEDVCIWNNATATVTPNPLTHGSGFTWAATFNCIQVCGDPSWSYDWEIKAYDPDAGGTGDWRTVFNILNGPYTGNTGRCGGQWELPGGSAGDWWDDNLDPDDWDLGEGLKFICKVKCSKCGNSCEAAITPPVPVAIPE